MESKEPWRLKVELFRKRFAGREDVYSHTLRWLSGNVENVTTCAALDKEKNRIPVTDSTILAHISGEHQMIVHMLTEKGIRFGALDFDHDLAQVPADIEDKEDYNAAAAFQDAKIARDFSISLGLPCYIARSRKKGYHLYWFFSDWVEPFLFTSFTRFLAEKCGFNERAQLKEIPAPEIFPKQTEYSKQSIGNGIRVPMTETQMYKGRNCWVQDDRTPVAYDDQWSYFAGLKEVDVAVFRKVLEEQQVEIIKGRCARTDATPRESRKTGDGEVSYDLKKEGDFNNIIEACPALKRFWEKTESGEYKWDKENPDKGVPHTARVAMLSLAISTKNGAEIVQKRWNSDITQYQIEYAIDTEQKPHTCKAMQAAGICKVGTHPRFEDHCLEKIPPKQVKDGQIVVNPDKIPEEMWPDPSPVRFSSDKRLPIDVLLSRVEVLIAMKEKPADMVERVETLIKSAQYCSEAERKQLGDLIRVNKLLGARDQKRIEKEAEKDRRNEEYTRKIKTLPTFRFQDSDFFIRDGKYWRSGLDAKGNRVEKELTTFTVQIREELEVIKNELRTDSLKERLVSDRFFGGYVHTADGQRFFFKTNGDEFLRGPDTFFNFLTKLCGSALHYKRADYDDIRQCVYHFSRKGDFRIRKKLVDFGHYVFEGEYHYITPSTVITKDGVTKNADYEMELSGDAAALDLKAIDESDFKSLALHIINDYFECNSAIATMSAFSHAMSAAVSSHIPLNKSPVLWVYGDMSGGKSFILFAAQCFFGNFTSFSGSASSTKSKMESAFAFRDSFLVIDDYKQTIGDTIGTLQFIQSTYDRSARNALKRDGTPRERAPYARGLVGFTSEDIIDKEASAVSRLLPVEVSGKKSMNRDKGELVNQNLKNYCGFTPYLIQYVYGLEKNAVATIFKGYQETFYRSLEKEFSDESPTRIAENLAYNMTGFRLAMDMMLARGVIDEVKYDSLIRRHLKNLDICKYEVINCVISSKGSAVFLDELCAMLQDTAHFKILGWPGYNDEELKNAKSIGFYNIHDDPDHVMIYSNVVIPDLDVILRKKGGRLQSAHHIGRQLASSGALKENCWDKTSTSHTKQLRTPSGFRTRCWVIKLSALHMEPPTQPSGDEKKDQLKTETGAAKVVPEGDTLWNISQHKSK